MTVVVLGVDALDPELVDPDEHPNLVLDHHHAIDTIDSAEGEPSTHELWPTIITGLRPDEHGLVLGEGGVGWENPILRHASTVADYVLPDAIQTKLGGWLLYEMEMDAFRTPASYYADNDISTLFDGRDAKPIGVPNYVLDPDDEDREHQLRQRLGQYMEFDPDAEHTHQTGDRGELYERCMEMVMVRVARTRRALRGGRHELVFGYTSGLDLIGHVDYDESGLQSLAYDEADDVVGELRADLGADDELLLVSDHGLQDGVHTHEAMVAGTHPGMVGAIDSVLDVREAVAAELDARDHSGTPLATAGSGGGADADRVKNQLEDLGYM